MCESHLLNKLGLQCLWEQRVEGAGQVLLVLLVLGLENVQESQTEMKDIYMYIFMMKHYLFFSE